jgi:hypothetical protein
MLIAYYAQYFMGFPERPYLSVVSGIWQAGTFAITRDGNHGHHFSIETRLCLQALGIIKVGNIQLIS